MLQFVTKNVTTENAIKNLKTFQNAKRPTPLIFDL